MPLLSIDHSTAAYRADFVLYGAAWLTKANRQQVERRASDLESLLPEDHRDRLVSGYVLRQDLSKLLEALKARGSNTGRAAIDPHILSALWLYATLEDVGSGREVTRHGGLVATMREVARQRRPSAVFHAVGHLRKPMDSSLWLGVNHSDTGRYREDSQRRHGGERAVLCAQQRETLH